PTASAFTEAISTAPAAMSLASFAIGSNDVVAMSIAASTAVFSISAISTNVIEISSAISSNLLTLITSATTSTTNATAKWMRMLRCVRRTWMTPSTAKLNESRTPGCLRGFMRGAPVRAGPSRHCDPSPGRAAARARAATATRRRRPADRARRRRARGARPPARGRGRRSGTRAHRSARRSRDGRASARASPSRRRTRSRAHPRRSPPRGARVRRARPHPSRRRPRRFDCPPPPRSCAVALVGVLLVGLDDPLDELVPHDVLVTELDELDPLDVVEHVANVHEPGALLARKIDLRDVAGDDDLRAEAQPRQEHLHLLGGRVLRLVEDDEAVVERPAAEKGERCDLDGAAVEQGVRLVGIHHVVERVEQRPHVRIDLRHQVARQESQALTGLDGGARQDDPLHLALVQGGDGERHREIRLPGPGRTDPERDRLPADRIDVRLLRHRLRSDLLAAMPPDDGVEHVAHLLPRLERAEDGVDGVGSDLVTSLDQLDELVDHGAGVGDVVLVALERQLVAAQADVAAEALLERVEHSVGDPGELGGDGIGYIEGLFHPAKCR